MEVDVSVIVTTKNEEKNIRRCLESIINQSVDVREIIIVDNESSDKTVEIARRYTEKIYQCGPERSAQRNFGIKSCATGKYVMYLDADMILSRRCIEICHDKMSKSSRSVGLYVREIILGRSLFNSIRRFERGFYDGSPIDAVRFIRRDDFLIVGGFDEKLFEKGSGEDWDLDKSLKSIGSLDITDLQCSFGVVSESNEYQDTRNFLTEHVDRYLDCDPIIFHNETDLSLGKYLDKKIYYASGFDGYIHKWGADDPDIKYQFSIANRMFFVFIRHGGWLRIVRNPILFLGAFCLKALVGLAYIRFRMKR